MTSRTYKIIDKRTGKVVSIVNATHQGTAMRAALLELYSCKVATGQDVIEHVVRGGMQIIESARRQPELPGTQGNDKSAEKAAPPIRVAPETPPIPDAYSGPAPGHPMIIGDAA